MIPAPILELASDPRVSLAALADHVASTSVPDMHFERARAELEAVDGAIDDLDAFGEAKNFHTRMVLLDLALFERLVDLPEIRPPMPSHRSGSTLPSPRVTVQTARFPRSIPEVA